MIYTCGDPFIYEPLLNGPNPLKKTGKSEGYNGGSVWKTYEEAKKFADASKYQVYGVIANWETDTAINITGRWNDLLIDSDIVRIK